MDKASFIYTICIVLILVSFRVFSQERQLNGQVVVFENIPVVEAKVQVKSNDSIYKTGKNGMFHISCSAIDIVIVTANGFRRERIRIDEETEDLFINLRLRSNPKSHERAYLFGHVADRDKLFAASSLTDVDDNFSSYSNMLELIEGRFPGVDTYGGKIVIRGIGTASGNNDPLIIVDGVKVRYEYFNMIAPGDVKSIDVIKDGTTAMYGFEGGNGVIIVETKSSVK